MTYEDSDNTTVREQPTFVLVRYAGLLVILGAFCLWAAKSTGAVTFENTALQWFLLTGLALIGGPEMIAAAAERIL